MGEKCDLTDFSCGMVAILELMKNGGEKLNKSSAQKHLVDERGPIRMSLVGVDRKPTITQITNCCKQKSENAQHIEP